MLMKRCGEGFWTGDPDIFPTGEGQLGVFSTLGLEPPRQPADKARMHRGEGWSSLGRSGSHWPLHPAYRMELLEALKGPRKGKGRATTRFGGF